MRRIKVLTALALLTLLSILGLRAAEVYQPAKAGEVMTLEEAHDKNVIKQFQAGVQKDRPTYRAGEFQFDVFGVASARDLDRLEDTIAGYGLGFSYFPSRFFGVGFQARDVLEEGENFANRVALNVFLRIPLENLSLYGLAQVGMRYQDHEVDPRYGIGGGAEYRFTPEFGVFGDVVLETQTFDSFTDTVARVGFRIAL